ncbi:MAG: thymidylate synthase [Planctomycetes bacterium]|nr:thymidylate synthase [Planctomycetota bacterium]
MMTRQFVVTGHDLSHVWAVAFLEAWRPRKIDMAPLVVTVTGLGEEDDPSENGTIRKAVDDSLLSLGTGLSVNRVAGTIFPASLWNPHRPRRELFDRFDRIWRKVKKCPANRRGHYFRRLTQFGDGRHPNQLEYIIKTYRGKNHRRSALQAALLDPALDHTDSRQQGFPCLQQVAFTPLGGGEMCVTGFYGMQYLFERAYGNYLGLCRLGRFMAHEMGLKLTRMTCIASAGTLCGGKVRMRDLAPMAGVVEDALPNGVTVAPSGVGCSPGPRVQTMWMS